MRVMLAILALALIAGLILLVAGPGARLGLWHFGTGFQLMRWAALSGLAVVALALIALAVIRPRSGQVWVLALAAVAIGGATAWVPWTWLQRARSVPPIHDITTDTRNPPEFDAVLAARADAPNPAEYGGPEVAEQQREAYPEIRPLELDAGPRIAFDRALETTRDMGWEIVATDRSSGRIEATATTTWFGFKDDVVVRIRPSDGGSRVDLRSVSRVGRSDVGTNARRIRRFLEKMRETA